MYLGIDLGTSNSAIVGHRGGTLELFKTISGEDVLPSVLMTDRRGSRYVGKRAYDQLQTSPKGIASRFKRLLGTSTVLPFGSDGSISPEEASAEVLRQLLKQVDAAIGSIDLEGTVITVPAAFNQMQSEATIRAAEAAGLERVALLQEPIAAALASLERGSKNGLFLVYDLGGGTFDVALVRAVNGSVSIEAHEGINMLGGSDFDRMIVDAAVRPWLARNYQLPADAQRQPAYQRLFAIAKANVERAKIELSTAMETTIFVSEEDARATDDAGADIFLEVAVTRGELERLITDKIDQSIALCRKVISDNGYTADDIDRVVLIGGPSRMPLVRERVPRELGVPADLEVDPMTAVARGAAIYAEGREWSSQTSSRKATRQRHDAGAQVSYDYEARTSKDEARIRVVSTGDARGLRVAAMTDDGRDYGEQLVADKPVFTVQLRSGETRITMTVTDAQGQRKADASAELLITKVTAVAAGAPCTHTIAIKIQTGDGSRAKNGLLPLIRKGETLPKRGVESLRSARRLARDGWIDFELFEQAEGVLEPENNLLIGSFRLRGVDLPEGIGSLAENEQINVHWSVDDSQLIKCSIELPTRGLHLDDHNFYAEELARLDFSAQGEAFAGHAIAAVDKDLEALSEALDGAAAADLASLRRRLNEQLDRLRDTHDPDGFRSITEEARHLRQDMSRLRHRSDLRISVLRSELGRVERVYQHTQEFMTEGAQGRFDQQRATAEDALDRHDIDLAERAIDGMDTLNWAILLSDPTFLAAQFEHLAGQRSASTDPSAFDRLISQGRSAVSQGNPEDLRRINGELFDLIATPAGGGDDVAALAGLRR